MTNTAKRHLALAMTTVWALGCDVQLMPETASYSGAVTPRLEVVLQASTMPGGDVAAVDVELVDVLLHRDRDDAWVWVAGDADRVELSAVQPAAQPAVPLLADHYDRVLVVVDAPRVASKGHWHSAELAHDEIEIAIDLDLDADTRIELSFDVSKAVSEHGNKWRFEPEAKAHVKHGEP